MADFPTIITADGSTDTFNVPWPYLLKDHVVVKRSGVAQTRGVHYNFLSSGQIQFVGGNPANGTEISIDRNTPYDPVTAFVSGPLSPDDLNAAARQPLLALEEKAEVIDGFSVDLTSQLGRIEQLEEDLAAETLASWKTNSVGGYITKGSIGQSLQFDGSGNIIPGPDLGSAFGAEILMVADKAELASVLTPISGQLAYMRNARSFGFFKWMPGSRTTELFAYYLLSAVPNASTDTFTLANHGGWTGQAITPMSTANGFSTGVVYYCIRTGHDTFKVASSLANALAGVAVDVTGATAQSFSLMKDPLGAVYVTKANDFFGSAGVWRRLDADYLTPAMFGANGDGTGDDTTALNQMFHFIRMDARLNTDAYGRYAVDLGGGIYRCLGSVNAGGIVAWNTVIGGGVIYSEASGKAAVDFCGSRGMSVSNLLVRGVAGANRPAYGFLIARDTIGAGSCDNCSYEDVTIIGEFSRFAELCYAQETTNRRHCRYWNYYWDAVGVANYQGGDQGLEAPSSDFRRLATGSQSFINNQYDNCDWRYLPSGSVSSVTGVTKGATTTIHVAAHPFANGDVVVPWLFRVAGITELDGHTATVSNVTPTSFDLDIDSSGMAGTYTSGASIIKKQSGTTLWWSRGSQHRFNAAYIVGYANDGVRIDFPDGFTPNDLTLDMLHEGAATRSTLRIYTGGSARSIRNMVVKNYASLPVEGFLSVDAPGGLGSVGFLGGSLSVSNHLPSRDLNVVASGDEVRVGFYSDFLLSWPSDAGFNPDNYNTSNTGFVGVFRNLGTGDSTLYHQKYGWRGNGLYSPSVSPSSGAFNPLGAPTEAYFQRFLGDLAWVYINATVAENGTGSGYLRLGLPSGITGHADIAIQVVPVRENAVSGALMQGLLHAGENFIHVRKADGTYPVVDGAQFVLSGLIRIAG